MTSQTGFMSPQRMWVIACHTFTQLSRMKVFYFLIVFAVLMIGVNFFVIPKDIEDRTLYTILSKPVPRIDYLFGKLLGVLLIIGIAIVVMDALLCTVVHVRAQGLDLIGFKGLIQEEMTSFIIDSKRNGIGEEELKQASERKLAELQALGVTQRMQIGVLAIYLKTIVISAVALLLSTFSTSTLFTIIVTFVVWAIGMFQHEAKEAYTLVTSFGESWYVNLGTSLIAVIFPDLHVYSVTDSVTQAKAAPIPLRDIARMLIISPIYTAIYTILSWFVFRKKEF